MGYIYKITNKINGKGYVGKTTQAIQTRWKQHVHTAFKENDYGKYAIHYALKKYGIQSFQFKILQIVNDSQLDKQETYWIKQENTYYKEGYGYNLTYGGEGRNKVNIDKILQYWNQGLLIKEIAQKLQCTSITCSMHLRSNGITIKEIYERRCQFNSRRQQSLIYQFDLNGNFIKEWSSLTQIHDELGYEKSELSNCTNHKIRQAYGFLWTKTKQDIVQSLQFYKKKKYKRNRLVGQYTLDGQLIKIWQSAELAGKTIGVDPTAIRRVCNHNYRYKTSKGFKWEYVD